MTNSTDFLNPQTDTEKEIANLLMDSAQTFYETSRANGDTHEEAQKFAMWAVKKIYN